MQKFLPFRPAFAWLRHICSVELTFTNERTVTNWCRAGACRHAAVFRREAARRRATALHSPASLRIRRDRLVGTCGGADIPNMVASNRMSNRLVPPPVFFSRHSAVGSTLG